MVKLGTFRGVGRGGGGGSGGGANFIHFLHKLLGQRSVKKKPFKNQHLKRPSLEKFLPTFLLIQVVMGCMA